MFGLGIPEMVIIGVVAVLVFGPKRIPELGNALGKTLRGFKEEIDKPSESDDDYDDDENP
jgi:sec-independent protein translocase protein TatA